MFKAVKFSDETDGAPSVEFVIGLKNVRDKGFLNGWSTSEIVDQMVFPDLVLSEKNQTEKFPMFFEDSNISGRGIFVHPSVESVFSGFNLGNFQKCKVRIYHDESLIKYETYIYYRLIEKNEYIDLPNCTFSRCRFIDKSYKEIDSFKINSFQEFRTNIIAFKKENPTDIIRSKIIALSEEVKKFDLFCLPVNISSSFYLSNLLFNEISDYQDVYERNSRLLIL